MDDDRVQIPDATIGERLLSLKERSGLSLAKIATEAGYQAASSVQKLFHPDYNPAHLSRAVADRLIVALEGRGHPAIVRDELLELVEGRDAKEHFNQHFTRLMREERSDIPIYHSKVSLRKVEGTDGNLLPVFALSLARMPTRFKAPPHLDLRDVVGFRVPLGNMWPKYDLNELIWYSDTDTPRIGDIVIAKIAGDTDGQNACYLLGRLIDLNDMEVKLSQLAPERVNVIDRARVQSLKRILSYEDLMPVEDAIR